ncbi:MAG: hypothetical protein F4Z82_01125 [Caldilineaceae bacterium SB0668_bin_21]|nr:hypothetical protein [Caldilineaceae bacterium SB0668_bin_21]MYC21850.1 hypothetical protein [Caldilineaceae bacterium SB0662_bin_25]
MNHKNTLPYGKPSPGAGGGTKSRTLSIRGSGGKGDILKSDWKTKARAGALCLLCMLLLLSGCEPPEPSPELNIDLGMILPEEWKAVSTWESINIDADAEEEYLLFYRYDASTTADGEGIDGPVGAVIYDSQTPIGMPEESDDSSRPPAPWLQPYALLPNYWQGAGFGFVAPPRQTGRPEWIVVRREDPRETENRYFEVLAEQMPASVSGKAVGEAPSELPDHDELIVYGGNSPIGGPTYISIFWWSTISEGYGSTQISAPGGLQVEEWDGAANGSPMRTVRARYPQYDRSLLCKESRFERRLDPNFTSPGAFRAAIYYEEGPRKLIFCYGIPQSPFYPEAVVLAYLLRPDRNAQLLIEEARQTVPQALEGFVWVDALQYMATIPTFAGQADTSQRITTQVWASLIYQAGSGLESKLFAFTLEHVPSDLSNRTTDEWRIVGVEQQG